MTGIVFDVDDTLYKELDYRRSGYHTVARHFAASCGVSVEDLFHIMAADPTQAFENVQALARSRGVEVTVDQQLMVYRSHRPDIYLDEDAWTVLESLRSRGIPTGIITDGRAWGQLNKISALELARYIDPSCIMATVLSDTDKHQATPFVDMSERLRNMGATRLVYVGDNPSKDFHHPNMLGWHTVMLRDTNHQNVHAQNLEAVPPEYRPRTVISSLLTVLSFVSL